MKASIHTKHFLVYIMTFLALLTELRAQPFSLDERVKPTELNLMEYRKDDSLRRGMINVTTVTQVNDTAYYFVQGLSIYSPVYFGLTSKADSGNIRVLLCKGNWKTADREGETGSKGHWEELFKTEGDFGIMVIPERKPAEYTMITWMGKEARDVGMGSAFKDGVAGEDLKTGSKGGSFFKDNLLYIIIGVLVIVIGVLLFRMKKNKK